MKFYNFETMFLTLAEGLNKYLQDRGIYREVSGGSGFYHFEIKATPEQAKNINAWIERHTITEQQ